MKFGGTSVADAGAIGRLCAIVAAEPGPRLVVVSALAGVTDQLLAVVALAEQDRLPDARKDTHRIRSRHAAAARVIRDAARRRALLADLAGHWADLDALVRAAAVLRAATPALRDAVAAIGELASSRLIAAALSDAGVPARWVDARTVVATDASHECAVPLHDETAARAARQIAPALQRGLVPVVGGFVGSTLRGATTTLGRGGSDLSASLAGACLGASEIQIWTDTDGVLTADPRILEHVTTVEGLSFREASALAFFGAKVLHPATVAPAVERGIPVRVLNARRPDAGGTAIARDVSGRGAPLAGLASVADITLIDVALPVDGERGRVLGRVFALCAGTRATVYASAIGDAEVSLAVSGGAAADELWSALAVLDGSCRRDGLALVAAVGEGLTDGRVVVRDIVRALRDVPVVAVSGVPQAGYTALVVSRADLVRAVAALHAGFFAPTPRAGQADWRRFHAVAGPAPVRVRRDEVTL